MINPRVKLGIDDSYGIAFQEDSGRSCYSPTRAVIANYSCQGLENFVETLQLLLPKYEGKLCKIWDVSAPPDEDTIYVEFFNRDVIEEIASVISAIKIHLYKVVVEKKASLSVRANCPEDAIGQIEVMYNNGKLDNFFANQYPKIYIEVGV